MRMFWGGTSRRKLPSPEIITSLNINDKSYCSPASENLCMNTARELYNSRDVEDSLLQISRERPVTNEGLMNSKRPSLEEILADRSPDPWTLQAFSTYCARNMCAENLNFIIDTRIFVRNYSLWRADHPDDTPDSASDVRSFQLNGMWKRILREYITPNGLQEINLSATIRDKLLSIPENKVPPDPAVLQPAIRSIRALMEDSILLSFLNEKLPQTTSPHSPTEEVAEYLEHRHSSSADRQSLNKYSSKSSASQIPPPTINLPLSPPATTNVVANLFHKRPATHNQTTTNTSARQKAFPPTKTESYGSSSSNPYSEHGTDDTSAISMSSASTHTHGSTTPPTTPGNIPHRERRPSPWSRNDVSWKKISSKLGLKKKASGPLLKGGEHAVEEEDEGHP